MTMMIVIVFLVHTHMQRTYRHKMDRQMAMTQSHVYSNLINSTKQGCYLHLHHEAPLPAEVDDVAVDVDLALRLQAFHHGVDADVGSRPAHSCAVYTHTHTRILCRCQHIKKRAPKKV